MSNSPPKLTEKGSPGNKKGGSGGGGGVGGGGGGGGGYRSRTGSNIGDSADDIDLSIDSVPDWMLKAQSDSLNQLPFIGHDEMIKKFVITGGPCSGKTTAMGRLTEFLQDKGYRVFVAIEAATVLFTNGVSPKDLENPNCEEAFQQFVLNFQMTVEDNLFKYAKTTGQKSVILCDRGLMDGSAYVTAKQWESVLAKCKVPSVSNLGDGAEKLEMIGLNNMTARDQRYDAVFHLVTAADGAPQYFTLANNKARHETPEQARQQDMKTQTAWSGHPQHIIIDNKNKNFEQKMEELVGFVSKYVGLPVLMRKSRKYYLRDGFGVCKWIDNPNGGFHKICGPQGTPDIDEGVHIFEVEKIILSVDKFTSASSSLSRSNSQMLSRSNSLQMVADADTPPRAKDGKIIKVFIRKRSQNSLHSYGLTIVKELADGDKIELKDVINEKYYKMLQNFKDDNHATIKEKRLHFIYNKQSFVIHEIERPRKSRILECQANQDDPDFPPCCGVQEKDEIVQDSDDTLDTFSYNISLKRENNNMEFASSTAAGGGGSRGGISIAPGFGIISKAGLQPNTSSTDLTRALLSNCYFKLSDWSTEIHVESKLANLNITEVDLKSFQDILTCGMFDHFISTRFMDDQSPSNKPESCLYNYSSQSDTFKTHLKNLSNEAIRQFGSIFAYPFDKISLVASEDNDTNEVLEEEGAADGPAPMKQDSAIAESRLMERSFKLFLDFFSISAN